MSKMMVHFEGLMELNSTYTELSYIVIILLKMMIIIMRRTRRRRMRDRKRKHEANMS